MIISRSFVTSIIFAIGLLFQTNSGNTSRVQLKLNLKELADLRPKNTGKWTWKSIVPDSFTLSDSQVLEIHRDPFTHSFTASETSRLPINLLNLALSKKTKLAPLKHLVKPRRASRSSQTAAPPTPEVKLSIKYRGASHYLLAGYIKFPGAQIVIHQGRVEAEYEDGKCYSLRVIPSVSSLETVMEVVAKPPQTSATASRPAEIPETTV